MQITLKGHMQLNEAERVTLRQRVESEFRGYVASYSVMRAGGLLGVALSKKHFEDDVARMLACVVDPYLDRYDLGNGILSSDRDMLGYRPAFVVAEDDPYFLLFDYVAEDFVLAWKASNGQLKSWGLRGDAASTFHAR